MLFTTRRARVIRIESTAIGAVTLARMGAAGFEKFLTVSETWPPLEPVGELLQPLMTNKNASVNAPNPLPKSRLLITKPPNKLGEKRTRQVRSLQRTTSPLVFRRARVFKPCASMH